jgi:hypothetical protein
MAVHVGTLPRPNIWHRRFGPSLALLIVVIPFAVVLAWMAIAAPPASQTDVAATIRDTAGLVDAHANAMIDIGQRITATATASTASDRITWIAYGQHMISDGQGLHALGARLRDTATVAEADPLHTGHNVALAALRARWEELRSDGQATATHGRVMVTMAQEMSSGVQTGMITADDAKAIRDASAGMVDAGERTVRAANMLLASIDQMQRWMGNP